MTNEEKTFKVKVPPLPPSGVWPLHKETSKPRGEKFWKNYLSYFVEAEGIYPAIKDSSRSSGKLKNPIMHETTLIPPTSSLKFLIPQEKDFLHKSEPSKIAISIHLNRVKDLILTKPISVFVESDSEGYLAKAPDIPEVYGCGEDIDDAIDMLLEEIQSLYEELMEDDNFSAEWLQLKKFFLNLLGK